MIPSDDDIEMMVRSAIFLHAEDEETRSAALGWLDHQVAMLQAIKELGLIDKVLPDELTKLARG